jgi:hypothetical protein
MSVYVSAIIDLLSRAAQVSYFRASFVIYDYMIDQSVETAWKQRRKTLEYTGKFSRQITANQ